MRKAITRSRVSFAGLALLLLVVAPAAVDPALSDGSVKNSSGNPALIATATTAEQQAASNPNTAAATAAQAGVQLGGGPIVMLGAALMTLGGFLLTRPRPINT
jgi:hypothetical protein